MAVGSGSAVAVRVAGPKGSGIVGLGGIAVRVAIIPGADWEGVADGSEEAAAGTQPLKIRGSNHRKRSNRSDHRLEDSSKRGRERLIPAPYSHAGAIRPGFSLPTQLLAVHSRLIPPEWPGQPPGRADRGR